MIYTYRNARRATVHDIEGQSRIDRVMMVDTDLGEVECCHDPLRVNAVGEVDTFKVRFGSIHPIFAGGSMPVMFHCYGRKAERPAGITVNVRGEPSEGAARLIAAMLRMQRVPRPAA